MTTGALVMMCAALCITWGGAMVCINIAMKKSSAKKQK
ncbi:MetS family NSS transporter small subunit [Shewanella sp. UCD-KL12]|nr:MetS family NSS transporter small subunit [Shewanella sp. UCD-KL12]